MYGWGHNEELIGTRASRAGATRSCSPPSSARPRRQGGPTASTAARSMCSRPATPACKRLGVDVIDLYYQHRVDPRCRSRRRSARWRGSSQQGKVRALGLCEAAPETIRRAHKVHPIAAVQTEYSLLYRERGRGDARDHARARHLLRRLLAARSRPADRHDQQPSRHPKATAAPRIRASRPSNFARNRELVGAIEAIAADKGCTPAQLALAWLLAQGAGHRADPRHRVAARLDENVGAPQVSLSLDEVARISAASPATP